MTTQPKKGDVVRIEATVTSVEESNTFVIFKGGFVPVSINSNELKHIEIIQPIILDVPLQGEDFEPKNGDTISAHHKGLNKWFDNVTYIGKHPNGDAIVCDNPDGVIWHSDNIRPIPPITPEQEGIDAAKAYIGRAKINPVHPFIETDDGDIFAFVYPNKIHSKPIIQFVCDAINSALEAKHTPSGKEIKLPSAFNVSDDTIESWGKSGGLRDNELQMFLEGAQPMMRHVNLNLPLNGGSFVTTK